MNARQPTMLRSPAEVARLIAWGEAAGYGHQTPMLRAVMRGEIDFAAVSREGFPPLKKLGKSGRPVIVLIGDDDYASTGPQGWACASRLRQWARGAVVHGSGGTREDYASAVGMAAVCRRLVFIETSSSFAKPWGEWLLAGTPPVPFLAILPRDGGMHPVMPKGAVVQ